MRDPVLNRRVCVLPKPVRLVHLATAAQVECQGVAVACGIDGEALQGLAEVSAAKGPRGYDLQLVTSSRPVVPAGSRKRVLRDDRSAPDPKVPGPPVSQPDADAEEDRRRRSLSGAASSSQESAARSAPALPPPPPKPQLGTPTSEDATELVLTLKRRGEGWGEEIFPHVALERRPVPKRMPRRNRSSMPDPWEVTTLALCPSWQSVE